MAHELMLHDGAPQGVVMRCVACPLEQPDGVGPPLAVFLEQIGSCDGCPLASGEAATPLVRMLVRRHHEAARTIRRLENLVRKLKSELVEATVEADKCDERIALLERIQKTSTQQLVSAHRELDARARRIEQAYAFQKEFFAMMTHELRAPLNSILGFCEIIREEEAELGPLAADNLQWIEASARRMIERVNRILTLAKLEAGRLEVTIGPVALCPVLADIVHELRAQIKTLGRDITVTLDIAESAPSELRTDEEKLRHILGNLASNAAKFTEHGTIRIDVEGTEDGRVSVTVSDTGIGISEDRLGGIFELYNTGVWRGSGTGIGLALTRRFARLLGGDVAVRSGAGKGSTFVLVLGDAPEPSKRDNDGTHSDRG